jgi:hypothetical protein
MSVLANLIAETSLGNRIFNERQLGEIIGKGDASRYGLVNRALKDGSLVRLKRGAYLLGECYRSETFHPFAVAQALLPGSYVSFETALAWHGWIPEVVYITACVSPGRKTVIQDTPSFGQFSFHPLAIQDYQFLTSVRRQKFGTLTALVADPLRALMDLICLRKQAWEELDWLTVGMRVELDQLLLLKRKNFSALGSVYKHARVNHFLCSLEATLWAAKALGRERAVHD